MERDALSRAHVVADRAAAALLADDRRRTMLMLFAGRALTLAEAAAEGGVDLKRLHHHAGRFVAAGLLEIVGERRRGGRPMKLYRTPADCFFIGDEYLPAPFTHSLAAELRESMVGHGFRAGRGMLFGRAGEGGTSARRVESEEGPAAVIDLWVDTRLDARDLAALKEELRAVVTRFERAGGADARRYLIHAAAAPRLAPRR